MNPTPASAELMKLCTTVARMQHRAIQDGIAPTEVWLGPEHDQTLQGAFEPAVGRDTYKEAVQKVSGIRPELHINGLRIRRSAEPGVWVGRSYGMIQ